MSHINPFVNWAFLKDCTPISRQVETKRDARTQHSQISSTMRGLQTALGQVQGVKAAEPSGMASLGITLVYFNLESALLWTCLWAPVLVVSHPLDILILVSSRNLQINTPKPKPWSSSPKPASSPSLCAPTEDTLPPSSPCPTACGPAFPSQHLSCYHCPLSFCPDHYGISSHVFLQ